MGPYEHGWIRIFDYRNNLEMRKDVKIIFELDPSFPYRDSYVLLPSYGIHIVTLRGKISKDEKGVLYVDFKKSRISLNGSGRYYIEVLFKNSDFASEEAKKRFNFNDMWQGEAFSDKIKFNILK